MTNFKFSLDPTSYTVKNALLWENFLGHCKKISTGSLGHRIVHALIAFAEFIPGVSQIASIFEMVIVRNFSQRPSSPSPNLPVLTKLQDTGASTQPDENVSDEKAGAISKTPTCDNTLDEKPSSEPLGAVYSSTTTNKETSFNDLPSFVQQHVASFLTLENASVRRTCKSFRAAYDASMAESEPFFEASVNRSLWRANVYPPEGHRLPKEAYVLPEQSSALSDIQRLQVLQVAHETARLAWTLFSETDRLRFPQFTPEACVRDPELFNRILSIRDEIALVTLCKSEIWGHKKDSRDQQLQLLATRTRLSLYNITIKTVPDSIGKLTNLIYLNLGVNKLQTIPDSIGKLTNLTNLELGDNKLQTIPESIGMLTKLTYLGLSANKLQTIPESIGMLTKLARLHLHDNQLQTIPDSIGMLTALQELRLPYFSVETPPKFLLSLRALRCLRGDKSFFHAPAAHKILKALRQRGNIEVRTYD